MRSHGPQVEAFVNLMIVTSVFCSWAIACLIIWALWRCHWPLWLATILGIPLGLLGMVGLLLGVAGLWSLAARIVGRLRPGRTGEGGDSAFWNEFNAYMEENSSFQGGLSYMDHWIMPTVIAVVLTVILVPVFVKARAKARAEAGHHVSQVGGVIVPGRPSQAGKPRRGRPNKAQHRTPTATGVESFIAVQVQRQCVPVIWSLGRWP